MEKFAYAGQKTCRANEIEDKKRGKRACRFMKLRTHVSENTEK